MCKIAIVKKILLTLLLLLPLGSVLAQQRLSKEEAVRQAMAFFSTQHVDNGIVYSQSMKNSEIEPLALTDNVIMVTIEKLGQFALVAGSDADSYIAGYGNVGSGGALPLPLAEIVCQQHRTIPSVVTNVEWAREGGFSLPINPIVKSVRHQSSPYNMLCPYYIYDDGSVSLERCLVGCVATATEQVVSFWKYPRELKDSIAGFESVNNGTIPTIPRGTAIDFDKIRDYYKEGRFSEEEAMAVAELSFYLGIASQMSWGVGSSGANLERLVIPLKSAFGYEYVRNIKSYDYSPRRWFSLLMNELTNGRPIVYAGYGTSGGGHAFVIDGIDAQGYFHVTWGYGGNYDGYFDLNVLTPQEHPLEPSVEGTVAGLCHLQEALFMCPDSVSYEDGDTLVSEHRIDIDTILFNRNPDTNMYVVANISLSNVSDADVWSPVELFTYSELDSVGNPIDIDYLGLADAIVRAGTDTTLVAHLHFTTHGERFLGISSVDSIYLPLMMVNVSKASQPTLKFDMQDCMISDDSARFNINISNMSKEYWSGRRLTYSMFEGNYTEDEGDWRHFTMLNLPPMESIDDVVEFGHLKPETRYTFVIRNPWNPVMQYSFVTPSPTKVYSLPFDCEKNSEFNTYILNHKIEIRYDKSAGCYRQVLRRR